MRMGFGEILVVVVVVLLVFGANKIPQLGDALGRGIRNFKKATRDGDDSIDVTPPKQEQPGQLPQGAPAQPAAQQSAVGAKKA